MIRTRTKWLGMAAESSRKSPCYVLQVQEIWKKNFIISKTCFERVITSTKSGFPIVFHIPY